MQTIRVLKGQTEKNCVKGNAVKKMDREKSRRAI